MDQVLANHLGQDTPQASIVLACEQPMTGYHETNFSMAYSSHISWQSADSPVPNEVYPSLAFDSLFENRGSLRYTSILDRVKDRAESLSTKVSSTDKSKIDEYLTSVREVERRIERMRAMKDTADDEAKLKNRPVLSMERPKNGLPEDLREHTRLMCDIVALAFQTDKTRIASLLLARDLSSLYYPFLDVREGHHGASHDDLSDGYERISRFHLSQIAYLAQKLDAMPEGEGTVLDNSCLLFLSNMWAGWKHDNMKVPVVTAGGLGGTLKTGRSIDYLYKGDENRKICSLYLGIMDRMGVKLDAFGDATTRLETCNENEDQERISRTTVLNRPRADLDVPGRVDALASSSEQLADVFARDTSTSSCASARRYWPARLSGSIAKFATSPPACAPSLSCPSARRCSPWRRSIPAGRTPHRASSRASSPASAFLAPAPSSEDRRKSRFAV